jgi:hypothetical protein
MWWFVGALIGIFASSVGLAQSQPVRGAFPSPSIQILPMMVAAERRENIWPQRTQRGEKIEDSDSEF